MTGRALRSGARIAQPFARRLLRLTLSGNGGIEGHREAKNDETGSTPAVAASRRRRPEGDHPYPPGQLADAGSPRRGSIGGGGTRRSPTSYAGY